MSVVVVGTGTEVGKTVVSAVLGRRYGETVSLSYWKPVATGSVEGRDTHTVEALCRAPVDILPESYLFEPPLSPHLAAELAGRCIEPAKLEAELEGYHAQGRQLVIEGVGGVNVPLTGDVLLADLLSSWGLPCLVVATSTLGTINHTLLTLEALRRRRLAVAGVVMSGVPNRENRRAIERFGDVPVLAEVELMDPLNAGAVDRAAGTFDSDGVLLPLLESAEAEG